ncbi:JmjC domain-containing protein [Vibrio splendidus]|uniref:JmjC domain-containing protein n=1 Tax=Vibrio splendidus TaxID=29497 RepID=UPI002117D638|nr:cupin domain-containing protein [Vibrio splendidus]
MKSKEPRFESQGKDFIKKISNQCGSDFVSNYWRKQTLFIKGGSDITKELYNIDKFYCDYEKIDYHDWSFLIEIEKGKRNWKKVISKNCIDDAKESQHSLAFMPLYIPDEKKKYISKEINFFINMYHQISNYLMPSFPSDNKWEWISSGVDMFISDNKGTIGGHYDTGDVFYFILEGEKEWVVEKKPDFEFCQKLAKEQGISALSNQDLAPRNEYDRILLKPGDILYVPPLTYHRVTSRGKSLAASIGLPAFNEVSYLRYMADLFKDEGELLIPFPSYPREYSDLNKNSHSEFIERMRKTLEKLNVETI